MSRWLFQFSDGFTSATADSSALRPAIGSDKTAIAVTTKAVVKKLLRRIIFKSSLAKLLLTKITEYFCLCSNSP